MSSTIEIGVPFPHGETIGGFADEQTPTGLVRKYWDGQFILHEGKWHCQFIGEDDQPTGLIGVADTPREAFDQLVERWTITNGGVESPFLRSILPTMRAELDAAGLV